MEKVIGILKQLETSSEASNKIGLRTIRTSVENLVELDREIDNQIQSLENNFTQE